jgi:hypothetical protein
MEDFSAKTAKRAEMVSPPHPWIHGRRSDHFRGIISFFHQQKTRFLLMKIKSSLSRRLSVLPCCIQREADVITAILIAVFAVKY